MNESDTPIDGAAMTDQDPTLTAPTPVQPSRPWRRMGMILLVPAAAALALYAALPRTAPTTSFITGGGCDHTPDAKGFSACPHGVDANGGCNMNVAGAPNPVPALPGTLLDWILPKGWTAEKNDGGLRYATLKPGGPGKVDVSVIVLPGPAGGELANVNRWRGQVGLPPIDEAAMDVLRIRVKARAGQVSVFDLHNPKEPEGRMVVGMLGLGSDIWFVKMAGDRASVAEAIPAFMKVVESLRSNESSS